MDRELDELGDAPLETEALIRCPHCEQRVAADAESCFRCHHTLLFDIVVEPPLEGAAARSSVARAVAAVSPEADVEQVQAALAKSGAPLVEGLTRAQAAPVIEVLEGFGLEVHLYPSAPPPSPQPVPLAPVPGPARPRRARGRRFGCLSFLLLIGGLGRLISHGWTEPSRAPAPAPQVQRRAVAAPVPPLRDVAAKASASTATVRCADSAGMGFFVAPDQLVTVDRLLCRDGLDPAVELRDGRHLVGTLSARDPRLGLAVLHVLGAGAKPLVLGDGSRLSARTRLALVGAPEATVRGVDPSRGVNTLELQGDLGHAVVGAPLLDAQGRVVAVLTGEAGRAVPIDPRSALLRPR